MTLQHFVQEPQDFSATVKGGSRCSGSSIRSFQLMSPDRACPPVGTQLRATGKLASITPATKRVYIN
jgi:hypothetical protein